MRFGEQHAESDALSWPETAGFLFAVQACPDFVMPSEWTEIAQGEAVFDDMDVARDVTEARMALMNWISDCIHKGQPAIPLDCRPDPDPMRILDTDNDFSRWCRGLCQGHFWLQKTWDEVLKADSEDEHSHGMALTLFMFFDRRAMAETVVEEIGRDSGSNVLTIEHLASKFHALIDQAAVEYASIGLKHRQMPGAPDIQAPVSSVKIGRNKPCPCGSGKKFKKCCGGPVGKRFH